MSKTKAPARMRLGADELKKLIHRSVNQIKVAKGDRKEINADITLAMETMENAGIPKAAARLAMQYAEWDEDSRAGFDVAYQFVRDALGVPFETQLFDAGGLPNVTLPQEPDPDAPNPKRGRPPMKKDAPAAQPQTQAEGIAQAVLDEAKKAAGQPTAH